MSPRRQRHLIDVIIAVPRDVKQLKDGRADILANHSKHGVAKDDRRVLVNLGGLQAYRNIMFLL